MPEPETDDGNEAGCDEDDVEGKQQAIDDSSYLFPLLWGLASQEVFVYLEADGHEVSTELLQLLQGRIHRVRGGTR